LAVFGPVGEIWRKLDFNLDSMLALTSTGMTDFLLISLLLKKKVRKILRGGQKNFFVKSML